MKTNSARRNKPASAAAPQAGPFPALRLRADLVLRPLLFLYTCLAAVPVHYHAISTGLDASWAFALNFAHQHGLVFGKDAGFTYGPLAYLAIPMPVGRNLAAGIAFQLTVWAIFAALLAWFTFRRRLPLLRLLLFAAGLVLGAGSFHLFGYAGVDTFLVFLALLLAGAALIEPRWFIFYMGALALGALLFFIKFSSAISILSALAILAAALFLSDRRKAWPALAGLAVWPLLAALCWQYARLGLEISSGYSVAMSLPGSPAMVTKALLMLLAWLTMTAVLWWRKAPSWPLAAACAGPLFLEFKHSFVREPGHIEIVFYFLPLLWAAIALFTDFPKKDAWYRAAALALPIAACYPMLYPAPVFQNISTLRDVAHYQALQARLEAESKQALAADRLPDSLIARVGNHPVAPFPNECAYAAANKLNTRLFPLFQMYQAYTPFLDEMNARFLEDPKRAPDFIIVDWEAIDERHPLLDVPATTRAMYRRYTFDSTHANHVLLRLTNPRPASTQSSTQPFTEPLRVPPSDHPLAARIHLRWTLKGQLLRFFFRLPEVRLIAKAASGRVLSARIPSESLAGGVPLNYIPFDQADAQALFNHAPIDRIEAISIAGAGSRYLKPTPQVEIEEDQAAHLTFAQPQTPDPANLHSRGTLDTWRIELLNDTGAVGFNQLAVPDTRGYLRISGWAVINDEAAAGVWLDLDGKPRVARYGQPRPDIAALFHRPDPLPCGFESTIPSWELGNTWHTLAIKVLTRDRSAYYDGGRTLRFKMEGPE